MKNLQRGFITPLVLFVGLALFVALSFASYRIYQKNFTAEKTTTETVKTAESAEGEPFVFTAAGDFNSTDDAGLVLSAIGAADSDFTLALGDLGYGGNGTEQAWCEFTKARVGGDYPFEIVAGNHDDGSKDGDILEYRKCLPDKLGISQGEYGIEYYFDYNNLARFILISPDIDNYGYDYSKGTSNYDWVAATIDGAREEGLRWVVLGMHKNCITSGVKSCEIGEDIINLAIEKGVNLVLQGHEHGYFRSKQLSLSSECPAIVANMVNASCITTEGSQFLSGDGTIIVISGAGGYTLREVNLGDSELGYFDAWNGANIGKSYGFSMFNVSNNSIEAEFISAGDGNFTDSFSINFSR